MTRAAAGDAPAGGLQQQLMETQQLLQERLDELNSELEIKNRLLARNLLEKERERNKQRQILDSMSSAVLMVELDGRITEANPSACELLGLGTLPAAVNGNLPAALARVLEDVIRENAVVEEDQFRLQQEREDHVFRLRCKLVGD
ncbi:MAG: PAS domain-containing protein, partial [Candidatus Cloacimonetes bacterium]|nr:PAS domain-containing protein [Candidatus Cloacimonadota bacterium]